MSELAQAIHAFQSEGLKLHKDATNPHFRSKFISLDSLMDDALPLLNKHGLVLMQLPTTVDGKPALRTRLEHAKSGEAIEDTMLLVLAKDDPQAQGSALTYARRYALMSTLGLVADEDDDGHASTRQGNRSAAPASGDTRAVSQADAAPEPASPAGTSFVAPERKTPADGGDPGSVLVPMGKHKGKKVADLDAGYKAWVLANFEPKTAEQRRFFEAVKLYEDPGYVPAESFAGVAFDDDIPFQAIHV